VGFFCSLLAPSDAILFQEGVSVKLRLPQNLLLKMALTPICCSNGDNNGARESCYYLLQRAPSYFL
ncbi:hypothetical protein, partial [Escherichia coli]